jgi:hypothetical protein
MNINCCKLINLTLSLLFFNWLQSSKLNKVFALEYVCTLFELSFCTTSLCGLDEKVVI